MTSRQGKALHTEVMKKLLNAFLPAESSYYWRDGQNAVNGVFLESDDTIVIDSFWHTYDGGAERKHVRRRITIHVDVTETPVAP